MQKYWKEILNGDGGINLVDTEKVTLYVSGNGYTKKPSGKEIGWIQQSIMEHKVALNPLELANEIAVEGKVTKLCNLPQGSPNKKDTPIINQGVLMVDIDNEHTDFPNFTIEDALKDSFIQNNASFIYETFSSTVDKPKFRVVFFIEEPFTMNQEVEDAYDWLIKKYPQSDSKCRETTRLFFGSTKGYIEVNFSNKVQKNIFPHLTLVKEDKSKDKQHTKTSYKHSITHVEVFVYLLLAQNNLKEAKDVMKVKELPYFRKEYVNLSDFVDDVLTNPSFSMVDILDLPARSPFRDIFHDEEDPSAGIYRKQDDNTELYKCFSDSNSYIGNLFQVVSRLTGKSLFESILLVKELLEMNIINEKAYNKIEQTIENTSSFLELMKTNKLEKRYPYLAAILKNSETIIYYMLNGFAKGNVYLNPKKQKYEIYNNLSTRKLSNKLVTGDFGYRVSQKKIYRNLTLLSLLGFLDKKENAELPDWMLENILTYKNLYKQEYRTEVYTLQNLTRYKLESIEKICQKLHEDKVLISKLDYDYIYNTFNKKMADKTFISNTSETRDVSNKTKFIEHLALRTITNKLNKSIYISENDLIGNLYDVIRKNKDYPTLTKLEVKDSITKCRNSICDKYGFKRIQLTKGNQLKYNITDIPKGKRPQVYMIDDE